MSVSPEQATEMQNRVLRLAKGRAIVVRHEAHRTDDAIALDVQERLDAAKEARGQIAIGIDPGTHTGLAVKFDGTLSQVRTVTICEAIDEVKRLHKEFSGRITLRIEDARLRTFFGKAGREKLMGAGSIKRDCTIWEEEMTRLGIKFEMVHPKQVKATTAQMFTKITGWKGRTSIHAREAAWLIL